jgi:hypothetical protein
MHEKGEEMRDVQTALALTGGDGGRKEKLHCNERLVMQMAVYEEMHQGHQQRFRLSGSIQMSAFHF